MDVEAKLKQITEVLDQLTDDNTVPRNIRRGAKDAKDKLMNVKDALDVRSASAAFILEELANDPNLPQHGRTVIWNLLSQLETVAKT